MTLQELIEYMKIHLISSEQDRQNIDYNLTGDQCLELNGEIRATRYLLDVANEV